MATGGAIEGIITEKADCCLWHLFRQCCRPLPTADTCDGGETKVVLKNVNNITCCGSNGRNVNDDDTYSVGGDEACQTGNIIHKSTRVSGETAV